MPRSARSPTGPDDSDFSIKAKDLEQFILYVRIEDNAGNVGYIGSDGAIFDITAPEIVGVENGKLIDVTKRVAVDDENLASVTRNGEPVDTVFSLTGDMDAVYVIRATDKAGNETEYTVTMRPIASITDAIAEITPENVKSSDSGNRGNGGAADPWHRPMRFDSSGVHRVTSGTS